MAGVSPIPIRSPTNSVKPILNVEIRYITSRVRPRKRNSGIPSRYGYSTDLPWDVNSRGNTP